jgi:hypothetical protein
MRFFFHRQPVLETNCPHCHEEIRDGETALFIAEQAFHRNCWIRRIVGPVEIDSQGMTARQEADAAVFAWRNKYSI